jgi:hypothetical protein
VRLPENDVRRGDVSDGDEEEAVVEGEREQPEARAEEEGHCGEDILGAESSGELQLAQTLRQQRGLEGSLHRSWLDRRRGRHHLSQGFFFTFSSFLVVGPEFHMSRCVVLWRMFCSVLDL